MTRALQKLWPRHKRWILLAGLLAFSLVAAFIMNVSLGTIPSEIEVGKIARQDIRADRDYEIIDEKATDVIRIQAGESIIRAGDRFKPWHATVIEGIRKTKDEMYAKTRTLGVFAFLVFFLSILLYILQKERRTAVQPKDLLFMATLLMTMIAIEKSFLFTANAVRELMPVKLSPSSFYSLMPVVSGAMIAALILSFSAGVLFILANVMLAGLVLQGNLEFELFFLTSSLLGFQMMRNAKSRGRILEVGLQLGLFNMLCLFMLDLANNNLFSGAFTNEEFVIRMVLALAGGFLNSLFVLILMPIFESAFNYLTPIKLLEYGSLNHPLLREMIVRAPGTYHHSHMVGTLAEAACEAIGTDSLFARVASYFHDIGKMRKTPYFVENQIPGENRHEGLAPSMSALIIVSHVKEGVDMAREHKLPQRIIDIIPQHQGTKLISYFYSKAKEAEDPKIQVVDEKDYRYPGPKPQTREAGVILLADTVEAATRALKDRSPARLEEVVRNMINKNFIDGQLDECELTLRDLNVIAKSFVRILIGVYHNRIEYPQDAADVAARQMAALDAPNAHEKTPHIHQHSQSKPVGENSQKPSSKMPDKTLRRIGSDRT